MIAREQLYRKSELLSSPSFVECRIDEETGKKVFVLHQEDGDENILQEVGFVPEAFEVGTQIRIYEPLPEFVRKDPGQEEYEASLED